MKTSLLTAFAFVLTVALSGCQDQAEPPPPSIDETPSEPTGTSTSPEDEPSQAPSADDGDFDDKGHSVFRGDMDVTGAQRKSVADAWLAYWQVRLDAYYDVEVDPSVLGQVATGDAAAEVVGYIETLRQKGLHTDGDFKLDVSEVRISGGKATLLSCATNRTTDRRKNGRPVERLQPFYEFQGELERVSGTWVVSNLSKIGTAPC